MFLHAAEGLATSVVLGIFMAPEHKISFLLFGTFAALFPDADFFIYLWLRGWKIDEWVHEHRDILHKPVAVVLSGGVVAWLLWDFQFGLLWSVATLVHFFHDTICEGWGIRWIPFNQRYFILAKYSPKRIIADLDEQRKIAVQYGDPEWFKKQTRITRKTVGEFISFLIALSFALWWSLF